MDMEIHHHRVLMMHLLIIAYIAVHALASKNDSLNIDINSYLDAGGVSEILLPEKRCIPIQSNYVEWPSEVPVRIEANNWMTSRVVSMIAAIMLRDAMNIKDTRILEFLPMFGENNEHHYFRRTSEGVTHYMLEGWLQNKGKVRIPYDETTEELGSIGYDGREGWYLQEEKVILSKQFQKGFWKSLKDPEVLDQLPKFGDYPAGKNDDGTFICDSAIYAYCKDGIFIPPQCQSNPISCSQMLDVNPAWTTGLHEQLITTLSLNLTLNYVGSAALKSIVNSRKISNVASLHYWWEPDTFVALGLVDRLTLPPVSPICTDHSIHAKFEDDNSLFNGKGMHCDFRAEKLTKIAQKNMKIKHPTVHEAMRRFSMSLAQINDVLGTAVNGLTEMDAACKWLQNNVNIWEEFIPKLYSRISFSEKNDMMVTEDDISINVHITREGPLDDRVTAVISLATLQSITETGVTVAVENTDYILTPIEQRTLYWDSGEGDKKIVHVADLLDNEEVSATVLRLLILEISTNSNATSNSQLNIFIQDDDKSSSKLLIVMIVVAILFLFGFLIIYLIYRRKRRTLLVAVHEEFENHRNSLLRKGAFLESPMFCAMKILQSLRKNTSIPDSVSKSVTEAIHLILFGDDVYTPDLDNIRNTSDSELNAYMKQVLLYKSRDLGKLSQHSIVPYKSIDRVSTLHEFYETEFSPEIRENIEFSTDRWHYDVISLERLAPLSEGLGALYALGIHIFYKYNLATTLQVSVDKMHLWLLEMQRLYHPQNYYHNSIHAADVLHAVTYILSSTSSISRLSDLEIIAILLSAIVHDIDHPGRTNGFLVGSRNPLALLYNDASVLENHHISLCFRTTLSNADRNIFSNLEEVDFKALRKMMTSIVLSTDVSAHFSYIEKFRAIMTTGSLDWTNDEHRLLLLSLIMKVGDVNNPCKPSDISNMWTERIMNEFFLQGDNEKALNMPISMFMDRETTVIAKCQVGFINFIVQPLVDALSLYAPLNELNTNLSSNKDYWLQRCDIVI